MLEFSVLASGSSGNAIYVQSKETKILMDAGISAKELQHRLNEVAAINCNDIQAVLFTHEHIDHVRGLKTLYRKTTAQFHLTEGTYSAVRQTIDSEPNLTERLSYVKSGEPFQIGDIRVTPFTISHDAEEPVMFRFDAGDASLAVVTDLGYVSDAIKDVLQGCQAYVFESNHDVDMLRAGRYPWSVKRRILGDKGHLSNTDSAVALLDFISDEEVDVYLAHLSEENNQPDLADLTVKSILHEAKPIYGEQVRLHRTGRRFATPLHRVGSPIGDSLLIPQIATPLTMS